MSDKIDNNVVVDLVRARQERYLDSKVTARAIAKTIGEDESTVSRILRNDLGRRGPGEVARVCRKMYVWYTQTLDRYPLA